ncbi:DTW domain-containing protein [Aerophototrophica crusticola]|uniref:tRNA-uridine aminocarboxypropyltransferase n=1 Tax=Aerophototrophica crusticola TaxID=1709002 RepID=A0A858RAD4_9PROT|nr:DTW domain-containing protein [Rhodospirillaceae bacterium B3]
MTDDTLLPPPPEPPPPCATCGKPPDLCLCAELVPLRVRRGLLVLQHPQEQDVELGTARLLTGQVEGAVLRVGLSWPNLAKALGRPQADNRRWGVLHMGSKEDVAKVPRGGIAVMGKSGILPENDLVLADLEGIVLIDGTWAQAKTLWWRNPWLLKLRRVVIHPDFRSAYGNVRKEPRKESVSTLEAGAFALAKLENRPELQAQLTKPFDTLLDRWKKRRGPRRPVKLAAEVPND